MGGCVGTVGWVGWVGWVSGWGGGTPRQAGGRERDGTRGPARIVAASGCPDAVARIIFVGRIVQLSLAVLQCDTLD